MVPEDFAGEACDFAPVRGRAGHIALPPVHLRQHGQSEGRGAHARQPARQRARDGQGGARDPRGRVRELAAALPRHGPHRRLVRHHVLRLPGGADVAARLPVAAGQLAARDPPPSRHDLGRAELRLRALPAPHPGRGARRARPLVVALRVQRRRAGEPRDHDARSSERFARWRLAQERDVAGLRPRRKLGRARVHAAGPGVARRFARPQARSRASARACRRARTIPRRSRSSAAATCFPGTTCAWSTPRAWSFPTAAKASSSSAGRRRRAATTATPRRPRACSPANGSTPATAPTCRTAWCSSPGAKRTSSSAPGATSRPTSSRRRSAICRASARGCVAVFGSVDRASGTERVVVLAETREPRHRARRGSAPPHQRARGVAHRRAGRRHRARAAAHRAEDFQRQDPPRRGARVLRARSERGGVALGVAAVHPPRAGRASVRSCGAACAPRRACCSCWRRGSSSASRSCSCSSPRWSPPAASPGTSPSAACASSSASAAFRWRCRASRTCLPRGRTSSHPTTPATSTARCWLPRCPGGATRSWRNASSPTTSSAACW